MISRHTLPWLSALGRRRLPIVLQATAAECGLACTAMIAAYHGAATDLDQLRRRESVSLKGANIEGIARGCQRLGFTTRALTCSVAELDQIATPCILHWRFNHFVVLRRLRRGVATIHDPSCGIVDVTVDELRQKFTGVVLEVSRSVSFVTGPPPRRLKVSDLLQSISLGRRLVMAVGLAIICECLFLISPLYLQTIVDQVVLPGDVLLLRSLLLVFGFLLLFQVATTVLRSLMFQYLAHSTAFDMAARVLDHLLKLPLQYFRTRELGDVQHRFQALSRIQSFIVGTAPAMFIDTLFIALLIALMTYYDGLLTALNVIAAGSWFAWRIATTSWRLRLLATVSHTESAAQTHFLETLRVVGSIKATHGESQRAGDWKSLFADVTNARIRTGNLYIFDGALSQLLMQGARVITVFLLAHKVLDGEFTVGMLTAYAAWLGMFSARVSGLIDGVLAYRLLRVPLDRLGDIVFSTPEQPAVPSAVARLGDINLRSLSFSYSPDEAPVLQNCNARFNAGAFIAIAGNSGSGKSSLLQLIAGIDQPSNGEIFFGGRSVPPVARRARTATVLQGDGLLAGSIRSNIALHVERVDTERVREAARMACVLDEIEAMPMGFESRVADLGSALSCGQVQRVLLARAYYRNAELLLLDEATSGLNPDLENAVLERLRSLPCTRIVVTHSEQIIAAADEVWWLRDRTLLSSGSRN